MNLIYTAIFGGQVGLAVFAAILGNAAPAAIFSGIAAAMLIMVLQDICTHIRHT